MPYVGLFPIAAHLFLPQSCKGDLSHNRFPGKATGALKAEGHRGVPTLLLTLYPTTFHPSALRWALHRSHRLTPAERPPPHREGTQQRRAEKAPRTLLPQAGGNTSSPKAPHPRRHQSPSQPSPSLRRPLTRERGPASAAPTPGEKAGNRAGGTKGRGRMRTNTAPGP